MAKIHIALAFETPRAVGDCVSPWATEGWHVPPAFPVPSVDFRMGWSVNVCFMHEQWMKCCIMKLIWPHDIVPFPYNLIQFADHWKSIPDVGEVDIFRKSQGRILVSRPYTNKSFVVTKTCVSGFCCGNPKPIEYLSHLGLQMPRLNITHENNDSSACHTFLENEELLPYQKT